MKIFITAKEILSTWWSASRGSRIMHKGLRKSHDGTFSSINSINRYSLFGVHAKELMRAILLLMVWFAAIATQAQTFPTEPVNDDADCGQVLAFDGSNDYISTDISLQDVSFSLEAWVKLNSVSGENFIFGAGTGSTNKGLHAGYIEGATKIRFSFFGTDTDLDGTVSTDTEWHHLAFTFDKDNNNELIIYFDGAAIASKEGGSSFQSADALRIGRNYSSVYFDGFLDEVKVWNRALTVAEVSQSASGTHPTDVATSLTAHYDFNDLVGSEIATDIAGDHDGILTNMEIPLAWSKSDGNQLTLWYKDEDGDGYAERLASCDYLSATHTTDLPGLSLVSYSEFDCEDTESGANPGATEILYDGIDNDCNDNTLDETCVNEATISMGGNYYEIRVPVWQSFTMTSSGVLDMVRFYFQTNSLGTNVSTTEVRISFYKGEGLKTFLGSFEVNPGFTGWGLQIRTLEIPEDLEINLIQGEQYSVYVEGTTNGSALKLGADDDNYSGGRVSSDPNRDIQFLLTYLTSPVWYTDADADNYVGDPVIFCSKPDEGYILESDLDATGLLLGDCDDNNFYVNPGVTEIKGDGLDNDCDPSTTDLIVVTPRNLTNVCGQVLSFDGSNDYIATDIGLQNQSFTLEAWAKLDEASGTSYIFGGGSSGSNNGLHAGYIAGDDKVRFSFYGNDLDAVVSPDTEWHHLAFTFLYDATQTNIVRKIYLDGVEIASQTNIPAYNNSGTLKIGQGFSGNYFPGLVDEVKVWNRPLTASEVSQSAAGNHPLDVATSLVAHYDFNDLGGSSILTDIVGDHNGALINMDADTDWIDADGSVAGQTWYADVDGDGYMIGVIKSCTAPDDGVTYFDDPETDYGSFLGFDDCDDGDSSVHPGATEISLDGIDNDCDESTSDLLDAPVNDDGDCGQVLSFDGSNDYISTDISLQDVSFSLEAWVKLNSVSGENFIFGGGTGSSNNGLHAGYIENTTKIRFSFFGTDTDLDGTVSTPDTEWHHLAFTFDKDNNNELIIYLDGAAIASKEGKSSFQSDDALRIGRNYSSVYFDGFLDEVKVWNRALTAQEITQSSGGVHPSDVESSLTAHYDFNNQLGSSTLLDLTGKHNGTLENMDANTDWIDADGSSVSGDLYYTDLDDDDYVGEGAYFCADPGEGYYLESELESLGKSLGDCDDNNAEINPSKTEIEGNGIDDDCDDNTPDVLKAGKALHFDGFDDKIALSSVIPIGSSSHTVEMWIKVPSGAGRGILLGNYNASPNSNWEIHESGNLRIYWNGGNIDVKGTTDLRDDQWHHIAFVRDKSSNTYKAYVDGNEEFNHNASGTDITFANAFVIGSDYRSSPLYFKGEMDEFRIWNGVRSSEEIVASMSCELNGDETGLVAYYPFNQGIVGIDNSATNTLIDATGNGYTGTLTNFALTGSASNWSNGSELANSCNTGLILTAIEDQSVTWGDELAFTATATDMPDLTYSVDATSASKGMTIESSTGAFSWTPSSGQVGWHDVTITVSDGTDSDTETFSIEVEKQSQFITFDALDSKTYGDSDFTILASASSGLNVTFSSSDESVATVSNATVTINGAGTTTITASQTGNDAYNAAEYVTRDLVVDKASQVITFGAIPDVNIIDSTTFVIQVSSSSGLPVSLSSTEEVVATISGTTITVLRTGAPTIIATQAGNENYLAAERSTGFNVFATYIWDGSAWNSEMAPTPGNDARIEGDYRTSLYGDIKLRDLEVAAGASVVIDGENRLYLEGDLVNNGSITIESGATLFNYGEFTGNPVTIKRNTRFADGRYSFVGTPVHLSESIDGSDLGSYVYEYDESLAADENSLERWVDASTALLVPGKGYTQAYQKELVFTGIPNNGTITYSGSYENDGWHLVSNPYPSSIGIEEFLNGNTNTTDAIYIWDDNGSNTGRGSNSDYIVANKVGATDVGGSDNSNRWNGHIGSMQGFFVQLDGSAGDITFSFDMRIVPYNGDGNFFRTTDSAMPIARINLSHQDGLFRQSLIGWTSNAMDDAIMEGYDAKMFNTSSDYQLYTLKNDIPLAIQVISYEQATIPLVVKVAEEGIYELSFDQRDAQGHWLYLHDQATGEVIDLTRSPYTFNTEAGVISDRFVLVNSFSILGLDEKEMMIYAHEKTVYVKQPEGRRTRLKLMNISGQQIWAGEVTSSQKIDFSHLSEGIYILSDGNQSTKIILK